MSQSIFTNEASKQHGQFKQGVDGWEHTEYLFVSSHHKNRACVEVLTEWLTLIINSLAVLSRLLFFSTFLNTSSFCWMVYEVLGMFYLFEILWGYNYFLFNALKYLAASLRLCSGYINASTPKQDLCPPDSGRYHELHSQKHCRTCTMLSFISIMWYYYVANKTIIYGSAQYRVTISIR